MGPENVVNLEYLKQAKVCIQQFLDDFKKTKDVNGMVGSNGEEVEKVNNGGFIEEDVNGHNKSDVLGELSKITNTLNQLMECHKNGQLMKCTACGAIPNGLTNGHSSEMHIKYEEEDDKSSSAAVSRIASVDSVDHQSLFEQSIKSVASSIGLPTEDDETMKDEDLVVKSIFGVNPYLFANLKQEDNSMDNFLQNAILPDTNKEQHQQQQQHQQPIKQEPTAATVIEAVAKEEEATDEKNDINNILEKIFANQMNTDTPPKKDTTNEATPDISSLEGFGFLEAFFNESMYGFEPSTSDVKSRKRKNTPIKLPKTENGNGYVCPMEGCNKVFKEKGSVHRHFVTHIGMRFNCDQCKASYTQKHALMLHQKIHSNPDAYQCRGCGTNYTTQNGLRLHRQRNPACMELSNDISLSSATSSPRVSNGSPKRKSVCTNIANQLNNLLNSANSPSPVDPLT